MADEGGPEDGRPDPRPVVFQRAVDAGAKPVRDVETQFYGDRSGQFEDPFGHRWSVATHVEDVPPDEMQRRAAESMGGMGEPPA